MVPTEPVAKAENSLLNNPPEPGSYGIIDSAIVEALSANFNPFDSF